MLFKQFPLSVSAIVIDLDGTLLHTAPELAEAANRMLRDMGRPAVSQDLLMSYIGNGIHWLVKRALTGSLRQSEAESYDTGGGCGQHSRTSRLRAPSPAADMHAEPDAALFAKALPIFEKYYSELLLESKPFPHVLEGLDAMKAAGFRLGCITNKIERYTQPLLKGIGLAHYFDIVLAGDTLTEKKPSPLPLLHSAKFFGVPIEQLLLVGDSLSDVMAARAAGCPIFCVLYGYNHGEPVETLNVDAVISNLTGVLPLIQRV